MGERSAEPTPPDTEEISDAVHAVRFRHPPFDRVRGKRAFHEHIVGLTLSPETIKKHEPYECGGGSTSVSSGRGAGSTADHTQLRFWTEDVDADLRKLAGRDIVFDELDLGAITTADGVATVPGIGRSGWFADPDPDGNTLTLVQPAAPALSPSAVDPVTHEQ